MNKKINIGIVFVCTLLLMSILSVNAIGNHDNVERKYLQDGNGLMQRLQNQIRDMLGSCKDGVDLETLTGIMTYDGTDFFIEDVELHFGPTWYITSAISAVDYDEDGELELVIEELLGLVDTEVTVDGYNQSQDWMSVFVINNEVYREPGSPIWSLQHEWRWQYRHQRNQP